MGDKYVITRQQLIEAFQKWNKDYNQNPEKFDELEDPEKDAERQADHLIKLLEK